MSHGPLLALSAAVLAASSAHAQAVPAAPTSDATAEVRTAVERVYRDGIAAFNRHALAEFSAGFGDDVAMYTPTGWLRGLPAVRARFDSTFRQFPRVRMEIDSLEVRAVGADAATVAFRWRVFPTGAGPAFHGVGSGTYVRRAGRWVEVLEHETVVRVDPELQQRRP
jgi:uncharacterized protein (TIGR02246 family)